MSRKQSLHFTVHLKMSRVWNKEGILKAARRKCKGKESME
jgi:hypothetical protein